MTDLEAALRDAWDEVAAAIAEHDVEHERRAWAEVQRLQVAA